jgi:hypothetical protein
MLDAVVEQGFAAGLADLRALVADDRADQPELLRPWQRARKRTSRASDDVDPRANDPADGVYVTRIEL